MESWNNIMSKDAFSSHTHSAVFKIANKEIEKVLKDKQNKKHVHLAKIWKWIGLGFLLSGLIITIITVTIALLFMYKENNPFNKEWKLLVPLSFGLFFTFIGFILFSLGVKSHKYLAKQIINKFNKYKIYNQIFNFLNLTYTNHYGDEELKKYSLIKFFKNISNFKDIDNNFYCSNNKYEQYEFHNDSHLFKMQNLEYKSNSWKNINDLKNKYIKQLKKDGSTIYGSRIELNSSIKRFAIAAKLKNFNEKISLTLFDKNNNYTPANFEEIVFSKKEYEHLYLKVNDKELLNEWLNDSNNIDFLKLISGELILGHFINIIDKKQRFRLKKLTNLSMFIREQEAYIFFDTPTELFDLFFKNHSINVHKLSEKISEKIIDDFYLLYMLLELLAPFGLNLTSTNIEELTKEIEEKELKINNDLEYKIDNNLDETNDNINK
ncbi:MAG2810 family protein [Mycoplasma sp. Mirounga ES2805-ORL]|uniref:MAG2810 family protein n=1 Tax=Mycoplasma sp. Mirounga ES2805-ORL TaxID=754514 RepID=UPI00197C5D66|nr:hypothetical protein [Mycoplasma sp. Mirounga ES2805-ORL]QSF13697.1 hypothetical protein JXZ90_00115 [Mycoplasma sp. Mirounga ES2805-ORL]